MYRFDPAAASVEAGFRAIALSQFDKTLLLLDRQQDGAKSTVHAVRRRCKKLRALLRLVRPAFADFQRENAAIRAAGLLLSGLRDAEVLQQTVGALIEHEAGDAEALRRVTNRLASATTSDATEAERQLGEFGAAMREVRGRAEHWKLKPDRFGVLKDGLQLTYRSARRRMRTAKRTRSAADVHDWRKANKNHGYHIALLRAVAPDVLDAEQKQSERLSELLGNHHDLTVLEEQASQRPERFGEALDVAALADAAHARMRQLETEALQLGRQLLAERPGAAAERYAFLWAGAT